MIVGIDLRCLPADGREGAGVAHAARFLTDALVSQDVPWTWRLYLPAPHGKLPSGTFPWGKRAEAVAVRDATGSALRAALRSRPCDLLFVPGGAIAPGLSVPAVPWVHDLTIYSHPEWFPQSFLRRAMTTRLFRRGVTAAPVVFAVSDDTKRELIRLFSLDIAKIRVTHEGGDPILATLHGEVLKERKQAAERRVAATGVTDAFILALGTVEPRKNLAMLIEAWSAACSTFARPVDLVIAGLDGWKMQDVHAAMRRAVISEEGGGRLHRMKTVHDDARRDLLLAADIVALPSLHEGFGLVALEAMQAETALIASRAGAVPEVVGDAGVLLGPTDVRAWSDAFVRLIADDASRDELARLGKERSRGFTWKRAAKVVVEGLKNLF